ncbi:MAG: lamin tail domain-containing protein, partial [Candidatus Cloacimonetes bacterium]|nr:lamin tail domain-containing protein [Candidatus Cloacimonadota bacterium]
MKILRLILVLIAFINVLHAAVVINEIMIDPAGADEGNEWIELYNNSNDSVNLLGWRIQSAGTSFTNNYTFQEFILEPYSYLLIGEQNIPNAHLYANLSFQNGGSSSDAIRLTNPDESYTDTFVYDSPNTNLLPDDTGNPATELFAGIESALSVARIQDGLDTNSIEDWLIVKCLTPGSSNTDFVDVEISDVYVSETDSNINIHTIIHNLSTIPVDISTLCVEYLIDNISYDLQPVTEFNNESFCFLSTNFNHLSTGIYQLKILLHCHQDINPLNNSFDTRFLVGESPLLINEMMHSPSTGNPEWIEIYNQSDSMIVVTNAFIEDLSGSHASFTGSFPPKQWIVLTPDLFLLQQNYPSLMTENIIETDSWASLNNSGDQLKLYLFEDLLADSVAYQANSTPKGISLEKHNIDNQIQWIASQSPTGASPGQQNMLHNQASQVHVNELSLIESESSILHTISLINSNVPVDIRIQLFETNDILLDHVVYDHDFTLLDSLEIEINSPKHLNTYTMFTYKISYFQNNEMIVLFKKNAWLHNSLPWVINEIMYNPLTSEPEWIELKMNNCYPVLDSLI